MPVYRYIVLSNPSDGKEEEYNRWYDEIHLPDNFIVPGMRSAQRFKFAAPGLRARQTGNSPYGYLAIYEIEAADAASAQDAFDNARSEGGLAAEEVFDMESVGGWFFEPIGPRLTPESPEAKAAINRHEALQSERSVPPVG